MQMCCSTFLVIVNAMSTIWAATNFGWWPATEQSEPEAIISACACRSKVICNPLLCQAPSCLNESKNMVGYYLIRPCISLGYMLELDVLILKVDYLRNFKEAFLTLMKAVAWILKLQAFRDVMLCPRRLFDPEGGGTAFLWKAKNYLLIDSSSSSRGRVFSSIIVNTSSLAPSVLPG